MGEEANQLIERVMALPEAERLDFAMRLVASLASSEGPEVMEAWYNEAERRLAEIRAGYVETVPWEQIRDTLMGAIQS